jgi:tyrosyl-tRNA synthetase
MSTKEIQHFEKLFFERLSESWKDISSEELMSFLSVKCQEIITKEELKKLLDEKRELNIKFGIDPTGSDVHLGHIVPIMLLRQFLRAGHHIDLVIGDFTAKVGDPSGRESARMALTSEMIEENMKTYSAQIGRFIDISALNVHHNSSWLASKSLAGYFSVIQKISLAEVMQREDFRSRNKNTEGVSLAEASYGVLMGFDSVELKTDIELGGEDQLLNFMQCRVVLKANGMKEEVAMTTPILEGTAGDGKKMSKSFGNYIAVTASSEDKFGKIMSIPDSLILSYFKAFADVNEKDLEGLENFIAESPLEAKKQLGVFLISLETGKLEDGETERVNFERKFSKGTITDADAMPLQAEASTKLFDALVASGQFESKSEVRRLFEQEAVRLIDGDDEKILTLETTADDAVGIVRVGKLKFFSVTIS